MQNQLNRRKIHKKLRRIYDRSHFDYQHNNSMGGHTGKIMQGILCVVKGALHKIRGFVSVKCELLIVDFCNLRKQNQGIFSFIDLH